jgi:flavin reductase (DIM6/NTAB) family NADH-FMN oxidoreductase RutF
MRQSAAVDEALFRKTCGRFVTGIAVATVSGNDGQPYGLTVNSFTSVSCCPPLVLICVDYRCNILPHFRSSSYYGINVLNDTQRDLSVRFSQRELDRFGGIAWQRGETGVPLLGGALACFECAVAQTIEAGDHAILIGEVVSAEYRDGEPLLYYAGAYRKLE